MKTEESSYAVAHQNLDTKRNVNADVTGYEVDAGVKKNVLVEKNLAKHSLAECEFASKMASLAYLERDSSISECCDLPSLLDMTSSKTKKF